MSDLAAAIIMAILSIPLIMVLIEYIRLSTEEENRNKKG